MPLSTTLDGPYRAFVDWCEWVGLEPSERGEFLQIFTAGLVADAVTSYAGSRVERLERRFNAKLARHMGGNT